MPRPASLEDAIRQALEAARVEDYDRTLNFLAFAFAHAANLRSAPGSGPGASRAVPFTGELGRERVAAEGERGVATRARPSVVRSRGRPTAGGAASGFGRRARGL